MKQAVDADAGAGQNGSAEEAVIAELRESRRAKVYAAYQEAARDPEFVAEMKETLAAFDAALPDGFVES